MLEQLDAVVLIGPMGSGKSTVGHRIAQSLDWAFFDTDRWIEDSTGADIPWIFEKEGEAGFRRRETLALETAMNQSRCVVSTGGGIVERPENRDLLKASNACVVYLKAPATVLAGRVGSDPNRPMLQAGNPLEVLENLLARRAPWYLDCSDWALDTDGRSARELACEISQRLTGAV